MVSNELKNKEAGKCNAGKTLSILGVANRISYNSPLLHFITCSFFGEWIDIKFKR